MLHKEGQERERGLADARVSGGDPVGNGRHEARARRAAHIGRPVPKHLAQQLQRLPAPDMEYGIHTNSCNKKARYPMRNEAYLLLHPGCSTDHCTDPWEPPEAH